MQTSKSTSSQSPSPSASPSLSPSPPLPSTTSSGSRSRGHSFNSAPSSSSPLSRVSTSGSDSAATVVPSASIKTVQSPPPHSFSSLHLAPDGGEPSIAQMESHASTSSFRARSRSPGKLEDLPKMEDNKMTMSAFSWWGRGDDDEKGVEKDDKGKAAMVSTLRPWRDGSSGEPKRKGTIPQEQTEGWITTRQRVAQAAVSVLGVAVDVTHEALTLSADLLEFAPVPGLSAVARTLLLIWDSLQMVDLNRLQCLRLTERCADILLSVRQEVQEAGDTVTEELRDPIVKLTDAFNSVYTFLQKQAHRPFLKRYIKRDEILKQISGCDAELQQALGMFSLSIQIRILKQVQAADARRAEESRMILDEVVQDRKEREEERLRREADKREREAEKEERLRLGGLGPTGPPPSYPSSSSTVTLGRSSDGTITPAGHNTITGVQPPAGPSTYPAGPIYATYPLSPTVSGVSTPGGPAAGPSLPSAPATVITPPPITIPTSQPRLVLSPTSPTSLSRALEAIRIKQNLSDAALDAQDLRNLMRRALAAGSDVEMLQVLGVGREEMPEAIKTMQRALEMIVERERREDEEALRLRDFQNAMAGGFQTQGQPQSQPPPQPMPQYPREINEESVRPARPSVTRSSSAASRVSQNLVKMARRISTQNGIATVQEEGTDNGTTPSEGKAWLKGKGKDNGVRRSKTVSTQMSKSSTSSDSGISGVSAGGSGGSAESKPKDTLDREFVESGIDALRRMSRGADRELSLPSWTITRYEVDREKKIGVGFFSDVYRGTWRNSTVAIKVLVETTPRDLFVREIGIWKKLQHPNVLELYGASSTSGDPPWFFVSPYMQNGSLSEFLRRILSREGGPPPGLGYMFPSSASLAGRLAASPSTATVLESGSRARTASFPGWTVTTPSGSSTRHRTESFSGSASGTFGPSSSGLGLGLTGVPAPLSSSSVQLGHRRGRSGSGSGSALASSSAVSLGEVEREWDLLRFMHEIAKGMEYLHSNGVLHGDLKAANVLVDDKIHCVISDFGQSEMKSEAYRISGTPPPHGTLRWQAPELMTGYSHLTVEMDVYAFAITCIEILSMGRMPWPLMDDDAVRHFVLKDDTRPAIPQVRFTTPALQEIIRSCWATDPFHRPNFSRVARDLKQLRKNGGSSAPEEVTSPRMSKFPELIYGESRPSPDMRPIPLPPATPPRDSTLQIMGTSPGSTSDASYATARERDLSTSPPRVPFRREETVTSTVQMPEPVIYTPSAPSSATSSIFTSDPSTQSEADSIGVAYGRGLDYDGYESPPPHDTKFADARDERRYRMLLAHDFHPSLTLPLWSPSKVALGAVGYLRKPEGNFVTLLNAFNPGKTEELRSRDVGSIYGYDKVATGSQRQDKRNAAQRGLDTIAGFLTFRDGLLPQGLVRRYSYPLRAGHKAAYLCTESTIYRYVESLDAPKQWFKKNVDTILEVFGAKHHITKEDLFFVIGALDAPDYGLFVSHGHPDGQVHFNVYASTRSKRPWGTFTTDTALPGEIGGPRYDEPVSAKQINNSKVSNNSDGTWDTVLIARLRFKPDVLEPTSL